MGQGEASQQPPGDRQLLGNAITGAFLRSPKAVFRIVYWKDVLSVEMKLESTNNDGW